MSSAGSIRSRGSVSKNQVFKQTWLKNHHNHNVFQTKEHSNEINRKNERLFVRLQEIHSVSITAILVTDISQRISKRFSLVIEEEEVV